MLASLGKTLPSPYLNHPTRGAVSVPSLSTNGHRIRPVA
jgi:hypothetical protein